MQRESILFGAILLDEDARDGHGIARRGQKERRRRARFFGA
jgi:hypothetical protein